MSEVNSTACYAISKYIDNFLKMPNSLGEATKNFDILAHYLKYMGYNLSVDDASFLLDTNQIINQSMSVFAKENAVLIQNNIKLNNKVYESFILAYKKKINITSKYGLNQLFEFLLVSNDNFETYKSIVSRIPYLSKQEEEDLGHKMLEGDSEAREEFILRTLKLVLPYAEYYKEQGFSALDLIQEGNVGLIKAVDHFDVDTGMRFYLYANISIKRSLQKAVSQKLKNIRVPATLSEFIYKREQTKEDLAVRLGRIPSEKELDTVMGIKKSYSNFAYEANQEILSLDDLVDDEDYLADVIPNTDLNPEQLIMQKSLKDEIRDLLDIVLSERERNIVALRLGFDNEEPKLLREIAKLYHLTESRISEIYETAIIKLIRYRKTEKLAFYTESPDVAKDSLLQKRWELSRCHSHYNDIDELISILKEKLSGVRVETLIEHYNHLQLKIISLFMGFDRPSYNAKKICAAFAWRRTTLRTYLEMIYNVYTNEIEALKLSRNNKN